MDRKHILIVEDDPRSRFALQSVLEHRGYAVTALPQEDGFWSAIDRHIFDAAVIDVRFPHARGVEVARELRKRHKHLRIAFVTVHGDMRPPLDGSAILRKPIDVDKLCELL